MVGVSRWTVLGIDGRDSRSRKLLRCRCECGTDKVVRADHVSSGRSLSCGCLAREVNAILHFKHGHGGRRHVIKNSGTYSSWRSMFQRCENPKSISFPNYGGRGITICERWREFANFLADMGERPIGLSLDRKNNDGNYEPGNCKWSTRREQALNQRPRRHHKRGPYTIRKRSQWYDRGSRGNQNQN